MEKAEASREETEKDRVSGLLFFIVRTFCKVKKRNRILTKIQKAQKVNEKKRGLRLFPITIQIYANPA